MTSDGGSFFRLAEFQDPGISVRDGFAKEIAGRLYPEVSDLSNAVIAQDVYDFAQAMTDEKLRRDKADRDERKAE